MLIFNKKKFSLEIPLRQTLIMGVLNTTPDSFSDGGKYTDIQNSLSRAIEMIDEGADIIDIGGESSRPGAAKIATKKEIERTKPIIKKIRQRTNIPLSIDTHKPEVADQCLKVGANIINDITGFTNPKMIEVAKKYQCPIIIMHMHGSPQTMQKNPLDTNDFNVIVNFLKKQAQIAKKAGIKQIILDPGIGFGKTTKLNLKIIKNIDTIKKIGYPVLIGASRKSFIEKISGASIENRLGGTIAAHSAAQLNGANIIRVHDVFEAKQASQIIDTIKQI